MSGQEDFAPLLEALVTCVGVLDVVSLLGYMFNRKNAKESPMDINNNDVRSPLKVRDKSPMNDLARSVPQLVVDGIAPLKTSGDVIESLFSKVNELETKVTELEIKSREGSMERFVEIERYRRSRSPSPYPNASVSAAKDDEDSSYDDENNTSSAESRASSVRHPSKLITRDDEFRKTKRSSHISHESREEELMEFSKIEQEETDNMDGFVPITYEGQDNSHYRHGISPIQEIPSYPIHGEVEHSPEPGISSIIDKPWGDIKKNAGDKMKLERLDQTRRSLSIEEQPVAEEQAGSEASAKEKVGDKHAIENQQVKGIDVNENFIKAEQNQLQQKEKMLVKQAHVESEDQPEEVASDFEVIQITAVEIADDVMSLSTSMLEVPSEADMKQDKHMESALSPAKPSNNEPSSSKADDVAVRSTTPVPDVSIRQIIINDDIPTENDADIDLSNISGSPSSGEGLKRTKRCIDSLDRSVSRSSSRLSRSKKSKTPSVASEEDYKEWFDKFDNHITPNLTVPENDDDEFDSDVEEDFLIRVDDGNLNGAEICKIGVDDIDSPDVSVSVTLNLKKSPATSSPSAGFPNERKAKTKAEEFLEMERFRENQTRRISIVPSTEEQQQNYVSILHPEEFSPKAESIRKEPHQHHEHLHNIGYNEWMKKFVDHHSSHLAISDSDSDSDVSLDDVRMLPLFRDEKQN